MMILCEFLTPLNTTLSYTDKINNSSFLLIGHHCVFLEIYIFLLENIKNIIELTGIETFG